MFWLRSKKWPGISQKKEVKLNDHVWWEGEWGLRENTGKLIRLASNVTRIREHTSMERLTVCKTSEGQSVKTHHDPGHWEVTEHF